MIYWFFFSATKEQLKKLKIKVNTNEKLIIMIDNVYLIKNKDDIATTNTSNVKTKASMMLRNIAEWK